MHGPKLRVIAQHMMVRLVALQALDLIVEALLERSTVKGDEIRAIIEKHCAEEDLRRRREEAAAFL